MRLEFIKTSVEGQIGVIQLNRPKVYNALNIKMMEEIVQTMEQWDRDEDIRVIVLTGNEKAFASGADIDEMADQTAVDMLKKKQFQTWDRIATISKPIVAAVSGYVLGGGCELMMNCDLIVASETAKIGQPEINLGIMPGAGGTVRLTKMVGKAKAMEMLLTGEPITAEEALQYRLVNKVVPVESYLDEAMKLAKKIAEKPPLSVQLIKRSVIMAIDSPVEHAMEFERNSIFLLFASEDQTEGMQAFLEKRKPQFKGK